MTEPELLAGKRILFVFCSMELGGAERQGLNLACYLKDLGCDVRVWGHLGSGLVEQKCDESGIPWAIHRFRWPCRKTSLVRDGWHMLRALCEERPDVILPYTSWANMSCGLTWQLSPAKVCIWGQRNVHDLDGHILARYAYRRISAVVCNAEHQVEYLRQNLGETRAPVLVVHNGINLEPCRRTRPEWRKALNIDEDTVVVTMVANFRFQKDHQTLLVAWRKLLTSFQENQPHPCLLLAGAPQQSYDIVYQQATELNLADSVHFLGQVKDISGLLVASDIGVLISKHEGLSNSVLEYMASALPVIATDHPGNREALGSKEPVQFCKPKNSDHLANRFHDFINDPDLRHRLRKQNQERAEKNFSINTMCGKMATIISDLLDKSDKWGGRA